MTQTVVGIIQARMGSTRLPGKVMLPLGDNHVLTHDIRRVDSAGSIDEVVVATSNRTADDIIPRYAKRANATVYRGSESDVLGRMFRAAKQSDADIVVRITGDCPLVSSDTIDEVVNRLLERDASYSTNILNRTFPRGLDVEAFTFDSFEHVQTNATESHHREHVTPYYREQDDQYTIVSVTSADVFDEPWMQDRTDLRLTLDEADDYELLRQIYDQVKYENILPVREAVRLVDEEDLQRLNTHVNQKKATNASDDQS